MKKYVMYNEETDAKIETTQKYVGRWEARGFTIIETKEVS